MASKHAIYACTADISGRRIGAKLIPESYCGGVAKGNWFKEMFFLVSFVVGRIGGSIEKKTGVRLFTSSCGHSSCNVRKSGGSIFVCCSSSVVEIRQTAIHSTLLPYLAEARGTIDDVYRSIKKIDPIRQQG